MGDKERTHQSLAVLASRQHGVVSIRQLEALGYSRSAVAKAARSGRLHRLQRGVYAVGHTALTWQGHCLAAVLACAPNACASHTSAAWLWGLSRNRPSTVHVTATTRRHAKASVHLHYARLTGADLAVCDGIPVTSVARTLLDLAAEWPGPRLEWALERAEELRLFDLVAVEDLLARAGGHRGAARLRSAIGIYRAEPAFVRSRLELRFLDLVERAGLSRPAMNFVEAGYELDAYWRAERFAVELDVYETHGSRRSFESDRVRQEKLKLAGIEMIRVTGVRLDREPMAVMDSVAKLLEQRRRQIGVAALER